MSSSQACRPKSKRPHADLGLVLEQLAPNLCQNFIGSPKNKKKMATTFQGSDEDLTAEDRTSLESEREQAATATPRSGPTGRLCGLNDESTGPVRTKKVGAFLRHEQNMSSHGSKVIPREILAVEQHMNRKARVPSKSELKPTTAGSSSQLRCSKGLARVPLNPKHKPLGHESKADLRDETLLAAAAYEEFQERMMHIPAEICQIIMDMVFDEAFGPRIVYPHKDPPIMNIFLALDRELYSSFHEQYWTKNTWVVSKGPLNKTMRFMTEKPYNETTTEFSLQVPNKAALQIRSAELSFSNADTPDLSEWLRLAQQSPAPFTTSTHFRPFTTQASHEVQNQQTAQRDTTHQMQAQRYDEIQRQLIHTWQDKFDRIAMLNLRHLTLDFTEAYNPGGLYLGVHLVRRLIPFAYGIPGDFKILAPDRWLEGQIREAFLGLNQS